MKLFLHISENFYHRKKSIRFAARKKILLLTMVIGILKEPSHDNRIAVIQESVKALKALNTEIRIEKGAGEKSFITDEDFKNAGA